jgi:nucleotide-binding universal stress UspA family protein
MVKQILFATEFSDCSRRAQDYAVFLANPSEAKVYVLHVLDSPFSFGSPLVWRLRRCFAVACLLSRLLTLQMSKDAI